MKQQFFWGFFVAPQSTAVGTKKIQMNITFLSPSPFTWVERGHAKVNRIQGIIHESWAASFNLKLATSALSTTSLAGAGQKCWSVENKVGQGKGEE